MKYLKEALALFLNYKSKLFIVLICMVISMLLGFVQPFLSQSIIDKGIVGQDTELLVLLCVITLAAYTISLFINVWIEKQRLTIYNGIRFRLEKKAFLHLLKIKLDFYNDKNTSNIYQTIKEDINAICAIASPGVFQTLSFGLSAVGGGVALFFIEWRLGLFTLLFLPINCVMTLFLANKNSIFTNKLIKKNQVYNEWFGDMVSGIKEIRLFGIQENKEKEITHRQQELADCNMKQGILGAVNNYTQVYLIKLFSILLYLIAGFVLIKKGITVGGIVAFQTYAIMLTDPIVYGLELIFQASSIIPFADRYHRFMDYEEENSDGKECTGTGDIVFREVSFRYDEDAPLLTALNFRIKEGSKVVIRGKNGVGKTTLLNLILRIITPDSGEITLSGENIESFDIYSYRAMFEVVSQNIYLFNTTIKENICLDRDISEARFSEILRLVNLQELVAERGMDYVVGENGSRLSGGQRQKIAIARALIHERPILIVDEATSNLDTETTEILMELFHTELKDRTVICVTHTEMVSEAFQEKILL